MFTFVRNVTIVSAVGFLGLVPGYYRVEQVGRTKFDSGVYLRASACAATYGNPLGELCKLATDVSSDTFFVSLFK